MYKDLAQSWSIFKYISVSENGYVLLLSFLITSKVNVDHSRTNSIVYIALTHKIAISETFSLL